MNQFALPVPQRRPLNVVGHAIIGKIGVHFSDGVREGFGWLNRPVERVHALIGELQLAESDICRGCEIAFELGLDGQGDVRGGGDRRRIRHFRCIRYRRRQGDRRR